MRRLADPEPSFRMTAAFSWKRTLLKAFAPLAAVLAYYVWRKGTAFTHAGRFWVLIAIVFVPESTRRSAVAPSCRGRAMC